jgi:enamine deaminase RidA (YjgF/YER057c/UK114 family)
MAKRVEIGSGTPWEARYGYCRAVRVGDRVEVAGTTAADENGQVIAPGDPYEQARYILNKIETALIEAGTDRNAVVRTRMFLTDIGQIDEVGRAHGEFFSSVRPASTAVETSALIDPGLLVEIEATAVISD